MLTTVDESTRPEICEVKKAKAPTEVTVLGIVRVRRLDTPEKALPLIEVIEAGKTTSVSFEQLLRAYAKMLVIPEGMVNTPEYFAGSRITVVPLTRAPSTTG